MRRPNHLQFLNLLLWELRPPPSLQFSLNSLPHPCWKMQLQKTKMWVSHSSTSWSVRFWWSFSLLLSWHLCLKINKFSGPYSMELVGLEEHEGSKPSWGSPLVRMETLMEISSGCPAMNFWVNVAHTDWELFSLPWLHPTHACGPWFPLCIQRLNVKTPLDWVLLLPR